MEFILHVVKPRKEIELYKKRNNKDNKAKRRVHTVPLIPIGPNDINVIDSILKGYLSYVKGHNREQSLDEKIKAIDNIRTGILFLCRNQGSSIVMITYKDMHVIREAMISFVDIIKRLVPQSVERDDVLRQVDLLQESIEKRIAS